MAGQVDPDDFMADLLATVDSSIPAPSLHTPATASASRPAATSSFSKSSHTRTAESSSSSSSKASRIPALPANSPSAASRPPPPLPLSEQGPPKLSLDQVARAAFGKPGSTSSSVRKGHSSAPRPSEGIAQSQQRPQQSYASSSFSGAFSRGGSSSSSSKRPFETVKSESQLPRLPSAKPSQAGTLLAPTSSEDFDDDDDGAWLADLDDAAIAASEPVAKLKQEPPSQSHLPKVEFGVEPLPRAPENSLLKRFSRTQSKLWAERAKNAETSKPSHRSYIRCKVLSVIEAAYEHPLPNSTRTIQRPQKTIICLEKPRRGAQYREDAALVDELPLATWDGRAEEARKRKVVLREEWTATRVQPGDYIHCIGHWEEVEMDEQDVRAEQEGEEFENSVLVARNAKYWPPKESTASESIKDLPQEDQAPPCSFESDTDLFAGLNEDDLMGEQLPRRKMLTMFLLSSSPVSDSPHANNLLILHADILVTATAIADAPTCVRKPLVRQRINGKDAAGGLMESQVLGCMLHEVLQACLTGMGLEDDDRVAEMDGQDSLTPYLDMPFPLRWFGPGRTNFSLPFVVKQVKLQVLHNLAGLLGCGIETYAAETKLLDQARPFGDFAKRYLEDTLAVMKDEQRRPEDHLQGLFRGVNGMLDMAGIFKEDAVLVDSRAAIPTLARVTHVFDAEEEIWSPMYGLKGKMDVSVEVELQETESDRPAWRGGNHFLPEQQKQRAATDNGPGKDKTTGFYRRAQSGPTGPLHQGSAKKRTTSIMPMEIKTGRSVDALEHRAQTMLYTLMMSDRYGTDVDSGLLYYTRSGDMHRVKRVRNEVRGLIVSRNEIAHWMMRDGKDRGDGVQQNRQDASTEETAALLPVDEDNALLPATIDNERECNRCFVQNGCMLYRKAVDRIVEDENNPSEIAPLYERLTSHLTPGQTAFYQKWERLLSLEEEDMVKFKRELWTLTAAAREELGRCFANMALDPTQSDVGAGTTSGEMHAHTYRFIRKPMPGSPGQTLLGGSMSPGDPCVVSIEPGTFSVAQGYVMDVSGNSVIVGLDHHLDAVLERTAVEVGKSVNLGALDITFRIDRDEFSDGMAKIRFHLSRLFFSTSERDTRHRELIVDLQPPRFEEDSEDSVCDAELPAHLNVDQRAAMRKVLSAQDYSLILGMPGTGKTTTIAELIRLLVKQGKTILLASYTHSAVDTILRKLLNMPEIKLLRMGNADRVHADLRNHTLPEASTVEELDSLLSTPNVVATTCLSTSHVVFGRRQFDYCIVDEASQITLPSCLGPLRFADKFVLVGDHFQLPPLVRNPLAKSGGLDISLFKRLSEAHSEAVVYLTRQYRMNEDIMMLSNHLIYDGLLKCGDDRVAKQVLDLPRKAEALSEIHALPASQPSLSQCTPTKKSTAGHHPHDDKACHYEQCWLADLLDESCKAVFVDTDLVPGTESKRGRMVQNDVEAGIIQQLARSLVLGGVPPRDIAVITPYRQQLRLLQSLLLPARLAQEKQQSRRTAASIKREYHNTSPGGEVEVMTADRSQGRDKAVVLLSLVRSNEMGANGIGELLQDWRRINVALTRAQSKVVIVGSQKTLSAAPLLEDFFSLMREQKWIKTLPRGALQMHPTASVIPTSKMRIGTPMKSSQGSVGRTNKIKAEADKYATPTKVKMEAQEAPRGFVPTSSPAQSKSQGSAAIPSSSPTSPRRMLADLQPASQPSQSGSSIEDIESGSSSTSFGQPSKNALGKRSDRTPTKPSASSTTVFVDLTSPDPSPAPTHRRSLSPVVPIRSGVTMARRGGKKFASTQKRRRVDPDENVVHRGDQGRSLPTASQEIEW